MLVDSHCHLDCFENPEKAVQSALNVGVKCIVSNSTNLASVKKNLELHKKFSGVVECALGYFPEHIVEDSQELREKTMVEIEKNASNCIAFGEVGLDFSEKTSPQQKELQTEFFRRFIALSKKTGKPLIVHARGSRSEVLQILLEEGCKNVLLHSFACEGKQFEKLLETDFFVSVSCGVLNFEWIQRFASKFPLERMLLETDSPFALRSEKTDPSYVLKIAEKIAGLKGCSFNEVSEKTGANFNLLFKKNL